MDVAREFLNLITAVAKETGRSLKVAAGEVAEYAAQRASHLATIIDEPGFAEAVIAERDAVMLFAGMEVVDEADAIDERWIGAIHAGLSFGARLAMAA